MTSSLWITAAYRLTLVSGNIHLCFLICATVIRFFGLTTSILRIRFSQSAEGTAMMTTAPASEDQCDVGSVASSGWRLALVKQLICTVWAHYRLLHCAPFNVGKIAHAQRSWHAVHQRNAQTRRREAARSSLHSAPANVPNRTCCWCPPGTSALTRSINMSYPDSSRMGSEIGPPGRAPLIW